LKDSDYVLFHVADLHIGGFRFAHDYITRTTTALDAIVSLVRKHKSKNKIVVVAGDLVDRSDLHEIERLLAEKFVVDLLEAGAIVIEIEGNHDYFDESGLSMLHTFQQLQRLHPKRLFVVTGNPQVIDLDNVGLSFVCVPCKQNLTTKKLRGILSEHQSKARYRKRCYGVVHEAINGCLGSDLHVMQTKCDLPEHNLKGLLMGDLHKCQKIGTRSWYCGSPLQTRYEEDPEKGVLIWTPDSDDPDLVLLQGIPKLIKVTSKKEVSKLAGTKHSVQYVGSERIECDASNVRVRAVFSDAQLESVSNSIMHANESVLAGLLPLLRKDLPKAEAKAAYKEAKAFAQGK
jgi:DNA repair exonuclease SbcCD nuclease subunit